MRRKVIWIDTETTGVDPAVNDIWALAFLIEIDGEVVHEEEIKVRPYNMDTIDEEALKIGGVTREELDKIDFTVADAVAYLKEVWGRYVDKYDKSDKFVISGYFVKFDADFLREMFKKAGDRYGIGSWCFNVVMDVSSFVAEYVVKYGMRCKNFKLGTICERFGVELEAHKALSDIKATRELYKSLSEIREL